jgi:hypothetical protein
MREALGMKQKQPGKVFQGEMLNCPSDGSASTLRTLGVLKGLWHPGHNGIRFGVHSRPFSFKP